MAKEKESRDILSAYRLWLNNKISNEISSAYGQLLAILWRTEFVAEYEQDIDRMKDCKTLREEFTSGLENVSNEDYIKLQKTPVRLIEVMIMLSVRINDIVSLDDNVPRYFWDMVASMEMNKLDDSNFNSSSAQKRIDTLLGHKYRNNGRGGLFFIKDIGPDYKAPLLDIWTQCMAYINWKSGR